MYLSPFRFLLSHQSQGYRLNRQRFLKTAVPVFLLWALASVMTHTGLMAWFDHRLLDTRMALAPKDTSGQVVIIAIDSASLDTVGAWPWPRSVHADLLNQLTNAGAVDVFFDIDFAFASSQEEDDAFARALDAAGGSTYLAAFSQDASAATDQNAVVFYNLPYAPFRAQSWPTSVVVRYAGDGLVREYPYGTMIEGEFVSSPAALLSGNLGDAESDLQINYALHPDAVPTYSAADVIAGRVPAGAFKGRSVIIGAYALELRDNFAVPVHGVVPGALMHALAAETLITYAEPLWIKTEWIVLLAGLIVLAIQMRKHSFRPRRLIAALLLCLGASEAAAFAAFQSANLVIPTAILYPSLIGYSFCRLISSIDWSAWRLRESTAEADNTRRVLAHVFKDSTDAIVIVDRGGHLLMASDRAAEEFALAENTPLDLPEKMNKALKVAMDRFESGQQLQDTVHDMEWHRDGRSEFYQYTITPSYLASPERRSMDEKQEIIAMISARNVTVEMAQQRYITYLSNHDERTGALRRGAFLHQLDMRLDRSDAVAVLVVNLHRFKSVNETFGRSVGDALLSEVTNRLSFISDSLSAVARPDGDRFALFTESDVTLDQANHLAEKMVDAVSKPYQLGDATAQISAHVGIALRDPADPLAPATLLARAEEAVEAARQSSNTPVALYNPSVAEEMARSRAIERALWGAIDRDEFSLLYQPQVRLSDRSLIGVEALIRWQNPDLPDVTPDHFVKVAETNGFIIDLGRWVLKRALEDATTLPPQVVMAVNVSALQMLNNQFCGDVKAALESSGLQAKRLCLELTETSFVSSQEKVGDTMREIEKLGATWALDDFGTGFSSMGYLSRLPLKKIKLDKQFIQELNENSSAYAVLKSVSVLCENLGLQLLCEGVETEEHTRILQGEGCKEAQGYLFGKPLPLDVIQSWGMGKGASAPGSQSA